MSIDSYLLDMFFNIFPLWFVTFQSSRQLIDSCTAVGGDPPFEPDSTMRSVLMPGKNLSADVLTT